MINNSAIRKQIVIVFSTLLAIGAVYCLLIIGGLIPAPTAVSTETVTEMKDIGGKSFQITHTDSDLLAKDEYFSVYISDAGSNAHFWNRVFPRKRALIFRYDPTSLNGPLPFIRASKPNQIVISMPAVSSVLIKEDVWKDTSIKYEIGHIDYPGTSQKQ